MRQERILIILTIIAAVISTAIASNFDIGAFCASQMEIPPSSNDIIESPGGGDLSRAQDSAVLKPGELLLRRRYGPSDYCIYKGSITDSAASGNVKLFIYSFPEGMTVETALKRKYYARKGTDPTADIPSVYFDNQRMYVELLPEVYWNDSAGWHDWAATEGAKLTGNLFVSSNPHGARVSVDGKPTNKITDNYVSGLFAGQHVVSVEMPGYQRAEKIIGINPDSMAQTAFDLVSEYGTLSISSTPSGAHVTIRNIDRGTTPLQLSNMEQGMYVFKLRLESYVPVVDSVMVKMNDTTSVAKTLVATFGIVTINSSPAGARISIDGIPLGETPHTIEHQEPGTFKFHLESDTCKPADTVITVNQGDSIVWNAQLRPLYGILLLPIAPAGFAYNVDGKETEGGSLRLASGPHQIRFNGKGQYPPIDTSVEVISGTQVSLEKELSRQKGSLEVMPNPPDADVYLDDTIKVAGPKVLHNIPAGRHVVSASKDGYRPMQDTVFIETGKVKSVPLNLVQIAVIPAPAPVSESVQQQYQFETMPDGASLLENSEEKGVTSFTGTFTQGTHNLLLRKVGFVDTAFQISVSGEKKQSPDTLRFTLQQDQRYIDSVSRIAAAQKMQLAHQAVYEPLAASAQPPPKHSWAVLRTLLVLIGAGCGGTGYYYSTQYDQSYHSYSQLSADYKLANGDSTSQTFNSSWNAVQNNKQMRNIFYISAGVAGGLFILTLFF